MKHRLTVRRVLLIHVTALVLCLLGFILWLRWYSTSYGDLATLDVTIVDSESATVSRDEFLYMLASIPAVMDAPRFRYLEIFGGNPVTLTPEDIWMFHLHSSGVENMELLRGRTIIISYDGNLLFSLATSGSSKK